MEGQRERQQIVDKAQTEIASALNIKHPSVSQIERQIVMYLSALSNYVEAVRENSSLWLWTSCCGGPHCRHTRSAPVLLRKPRLAALADAHRSAVVVSASYPTRIILAFRSGGVCAFPKCGKHLTYDAKAGDDTYVGEAAHIRGEKPTAARYDASMTDDERDNVQNLIYLCADDHTIIDKVEADWPTATLQQLKESHEKQVRQAMEEAFADVAFPELQNAVSWVANQAPAANGSFDLIAPDEKIKKNALSNGSRNIIAAGLTSRTTVSDYVEAEAQLDPDFPERLKAGFLEEYYARRKEGHKGDELFELMCAFAQRGLRRQADKTAGIAVLIYLFEICDVFEK